jgi:predicted DNA-binding transcriptional regulator AlpA
MPDTAQAPAALASPGPAPGPAPAPPVAQALPLAVSGAEAARLCGIGKSLFYSLLSSERFGPKPLKFGRATRFLRMEIQEWLAAGAPPRARWEAMQGANRRRR